METGRLADGGRFSASSRQGGRVPAVISLEELREPALARNLIRLADGRRFSSWTSCRRRQFSSSSLPGITAGDDSGDDGTKAGVHNYYPVWTSLHNNQKVGTARSRTGSAMQPTLRLEVQNKKR